MTWFLAWRSVLRGRGALISWRKVLNIQIIHSNAYIHTSAQRTNIHVCVNVYTSPRGATHTSNEMQTKKYAHPFRKARKEGLGE